MVLLTRPAELIVRHGAGMLDLRDGSGLLRRTRTENAAPTVVPGPRPRIAETPEVALDDPPPDLTAAARPGRLALFRTRPAAMAETLPAGSDVPDPPAAPPLALSGRIDAGRRWHPRRFSVALAVGEVRALDLFAAPAAVAGPALTLSCVWDGGGPASWAVLDLTVILGGGDPAASLTLRAQADRRGEARLPIAALPPPTAAQVQADAVARPAVLTARGLPAASGAEDANPDAMPGVLVRAPAGPGFDPGAAFALQAAFAVTPGLPARLASEGGDTLVLQPV